jgi:PRC-barrel domain
MATPSIETARGWRGRVMVDRDSNKIGEVVDIYLDNETDRPEWAVVRTGLFGMRSTFVPLAEAREVGDELQVAQQRLQVKEAPNIESDGQLSAAEEAELYRHYGLDYDTVTLDSGAPAGQALAEAADQTDEPERTDQAGAPATGVPEPASTATRGLADTGLDGEPGTSASGSGSLGLDREPDTSPVVSEQGRGGAGDERSTTGGEPVGPAGQDRLPVGEGVSRPVRVRDARTARGWRWHPSAPARSGAAASLSGHRGGDRYRGWAASRGAGPQRAGVRRRDRCRASGPGPAGRADQSGPERA